MRSINIFDFVNYRSYLRAVYLAHKTEKREHSFQYFAKKLGFASRGFFNLVIEGHRKLSPQAVGKVNRVFKHSKAQSEYFRAMVLHNQSDNDEERQIYLTKMASSKPRLKMTALNRAKYEVLTDKLFLILREAVEHPDFQEDPQWLAQHLAFVETPKKIRHALDTLIRLHLIRRDENGKLRQVDSVIATPPKLDVLDAFRYHDQILELARHSLVESPKTLGEMTTMTIPIPAMLLAEVHRKAEAFRSEIAELVNAGPRDYHEVFLVNVQVFPVTKFRSDDSSE